jgi:hypothetical protein
MRVCTHAQTPTYVDESALAKKFKNAIPARPSRRKSARPLMLGRKLASTKYSHIATVMAPM